MHINQRYANAFDYAMRVHAARPRRGSTLPASVHLMAVSALVFEHGGDEDQALAALLHDVIEVGGALHASPINRQFGARVLRLVLDCSEGLGQPPADWLGRKRRHLEHLQGVAEDSLLVSACDKLHRAHCLRRALERGDAAPFAPFGAGREPVLWYAQRLGELFARRGSAPAAAFARTLERIGRLAG